MDQTLITALSKKSNLKILKARYQKAMIVPCAGRTNIYRLLLNNDASLGRLEGKLLHLNGAAWPKIHALVKKQTGFDLLTDSIDNFSMMDRTAVSTSMKDEKVLGLPPMSGFLMIRIIGDSYSINASTAGFVRSSTLINTYIGVQAIQLEKWDYDALVVVENFSTFLNMDVDYLKEVKVDRVFETVVLIYRGSDHQNIYASADTVKNIDCERYVFADYDFSGLSLASVIAKRINATGYLLPVLGETDEHLRSLSKKDIRIKQAAVEIDDDVLRDYYLNIKSKFIAVTQESLMANKVKMSVVRRYSECIRYIEN